MGSKIYGAVLVLLAIITRFAAAGALDGDGYLLSVIIVGNVFCDTCYKQNFSKNSYFISGASVAVECRNNKQTPDFRIEAKTNDHGQFKVELPPSIFHSDKQLKRCSATLLQNEEQKGPCKLVSIANSSSFTLKSKQGSIHTYSAGFFTYRPQSPPPFCSQDAANNPKSDLKAPLQSSKTFGFPPFFSFPPFPRSPSPPSLPPVRRTPPVSAFTFPPFSFQFPTPPNAPLFNFPPNPFFSPPPQNPFFPPLPQNPFFSSPPFNIPGFPFPSPQFNIPGLPFFPPPLNIPGLPFPFPFPTTPPLHIPKPLETPSLDPLPSIPLEPTTPPLHIPKPLETPSLDLEKTPTLVPSPPI